MSYNPTGIPYRKLGLDGQFDMSQPSYGGDVILATAGATLLIGDVVYWSLLNTVNKSSTAADYVAFAGVVVGGANMDMFITADDAVNAVGDAAAEVGELVWVQINGIAPVVSAAALAVNTALQVVTTAGRVDDAAFVGGQIVGIALKLATGAAETIPMLIQPK